MNRIIFLLLVALSTTGAQSQVIKSSTFGKGINFLAADTSMSMKFHFRFQNLFTASYDPGTGSVSSSYIVRRSRLKFSGFAFDKRVKYKTEMGLTNRDISVNKEDGNGSGASRIVLDAVLKYQFSKHWAIWAGQTKLPGNRERVVSSANLQIVDRSLVNSKFNIDRDVGLQLHGKYTLGEKFVIKPKFAWTMGEGRDITAGNFGGYNYTARIEFLPMGEFKSKGDYILAAVKREETPKLNIGVTYNLNDGAVRQQGQLGNFVYSDSTLTTYANNDLSLIEADLIFKYGGFSLLAEYANTTASKKLDGTSHLYNTGSGINVQFGYVFKSRNEIAYRYTSISPDDETYSGITATNEYLICFSRYIVGHALKFQTDLGLIDVEGAANNTFRFRFQTEMQF